MVNADVDVIRILKKLRVGMTDKEFDTLLTCFGLSKEGYESRVAGLDKEYEFLCNLYLCNKINHFIQIDEKLSNLVGEKSCDAIVELKDGRQIMVEVKSTSKDKYSISKGNFDKRVKWAKDQGYPLYFAIKIFNLWNLFDVDQMTKWNRKIGIDKLPYSILSKVFGVQHYLAHDIKMVTTYTDMKDVDNLGIYDGDRDHASIKEQFYVNDRLVDEVTPAKNNNLPFVLLSEALKTRATQTKTILNEHEYTIAYELTGNHFIGVFEIYRESIIHMEGTDDEDKYTSFMKIISKNPERRDQLNRWLDELAKLLKMVPIELIPSSDNGQ